MQLDEILIYTFLNFVLMFDQIILNKYLLIDQYHMKQVFVNILEV